ncbi:ATP-binding protein [Arthrobacter sp. H5]|uniref:sensor histidine kinase n=1 Tax=Arthrobacter sp. H5 TaxID=1267973 RepID=UPI000483BF67|nr:ATP-binding protein [Arthrobacter sp. H5]
MIQVLADEVVVVHGVLTDSRPVDFYRAGVAGTIERLATPLRAAGVAVRLDTPHHGIEIDRSSATLLYRTAQELLSNIFKYAKASAVTVRIATVNHGAEHGIQLRVCDDGAGFDVERATTGRNSGMGLRLMRSTVDLAGGTTAIVSVPGAGSQVTVTLPLD